eukprot:224293-Pleurochrysis_carterae.AAC.3
MQSRFRPQIQTSDSDLRFRPQIHYCITVDKTVDLTLVKGPGKPSAEAALQHWKGPWSRSVQTTLHTSSCVAGRRYRRNEIDDWACAHARRCWRQPSAVADAPIGGCFARAPGLLSVFPTPSPANAVIDLEPQSKMRDSPSEMPGQMPCSVLLAVPKSVSLCAAPCVARIAMVECRSQATHLVEVVLCRLLPRARVPAAARG